MALYKYKQVRLFLNYLFKIIKKIKMYYFNQNYSFNYSQQQYTNTNTLIHNQINYNQTTDYVTFRNRNAIKYY